MALRIGKFDWQAVQDDDSSLLYAQDYISFKKIPLWIINALKGDQAKILDMSCGTGLNSLEFLKKGYEVYGFEKSPTNIQEAQKLPFKQLICQSLEEPLSLKRNFFDAVVLLGVMEFVKKPMDIFNEVFRTLRKGGFFGLTIPKKLPKAIEQKLEIFNYYKKEIEPLFHEAGFHIQRVEEFQGFISEEESVYYYGYLLKK
jgi:SAM-dependent methyltransferase